MSLRQNILRMAVGILFLSPTIGFAKGVEGAIPNQFEALSGAFKGFDEWNKSTAYLLIYPKLEQGQPSGIFDVYLLANSGSNGQLFRGEIGGDDGAKKIVLYPRGLDANGESIIARSTFLYNLELRSKNGESYLYLSKDGISSDARPYVFNVISPDITINKELPNGEYKNGSSVVNSAPTSIATASMVTNLTRPQGKFNAQFELTGILVLRPEVTDPNTAETYGQERIGLVVIHINIKKVPHLVVGPLAVDGRPVTLQLLKKRM